MPTVIQGIEFFTILETAELLGTTTFTIRKYIENGRLRGNKIGRQFLITAKSLKEFLEAPEVKKGRPRKDKK